MYCYLWNTFEINKYNNSKQRLRPLISFIYILHVRKNALFLWRFESTPLQVWRRQLNDQKSYLPLAVSVFNNLFHPVRNLVQIFCCHFFKQIYTCILFTGHSVCGKIMCIKFALFNYKSPCIYTDVYRWQSALLMHTFIFHLLSPFTVQLAPVLAYAALKLFSVVFHMRSGN